MVNIWSLFSQISGGGCPLCRQPGDNDNLCPACLAALPYNRHACPRCALPLPADAPDTVLCADCQASAPSFDRVLAPLLYRSPVDDLVADFKYHHHLPRGRLLAASLAAAVRQQVGRAGLLLPVPMQARRLRERGFNQAGELARWLSIQLDIPWAGDRLIKIRASDQQRTLRRRQRQRNVRGTFACRGSLPAEVALIDDVITTGATAEEASRVLKRAGVMRVEVWAVARTPRDAQT